MRISDWSSDLCSSDLGVEVGFAHLGQPIMVAVEEGFALPLDHLNRVGGIAPAAILMKIDRNLIFVGTERQFEEGGRADAIFARAALGGRSEEHTSELQSLMRISYAVFCLKKKKMDMDI